MHGEKIHEDRGIDRRYQSQKSRGKDEPFDWRELCSEPEAGKRAHQPSKSKGTNGGSGIRQLLFLKMTLASGHLSV